MEPKPNPGCCMPTKSSITGERVAVNQCSEKPESKRSPHYGSREGMVLIEAGSFLMGTDSDKGWEAEGERGEREGKRGKRMENLCLNLRE